jgi:outer membrane immunogenic protein
MKRLTYVLALSACSILAVTAFAGPEPIRDYKSTSSKEVAQVAPPPCDWRGFYIGVHGGYAWSDNTDVTDITGYNGPNNNSWSYNTDGGVAGGQMGYNFQPLHWLVLGLEVDGGWLGLNGSARQPISPGRDTFAETNDGFYTSWRARVGLAFNRWMLYATGGGFGSNLEHHVADDCNTGPCGPALGSGRNDDFRVGWTVGGGVEWMMTCHWSLRVEYLYYDLGDSSDTVNLKIRNGSTFPFRFNEDNGNIVRAGLNFKF